MGQNNSRTCCIRQIFPLVNRFRPAPILPGKESSQYDDGGPVEGDAAFGRTTHFSSRYAICIDALGALAAALGTNTGEF